MKKFLLTAFLIIISSWVFAQERIAVFPFEDMENVLTQNLAKMFYQEFSNEFKNRMPDKSVIPREDVDRLINTEYKFQLSDFSAREKTAEMNKVLNGNQILSGRIGKLDNKIRIIVSLYTYPELDQLPGGTSLSVANTTELFNKIPELVRQMQNEIAEPVPEGLKYEIVDGMTVTITDYTGDAAVLNIPSRIRGLPVTYIQNSTFAFLSQLTSVTIPSSVTNIGERVLYYCENLTSVNIHSSVRSIGESAFSNCERLTSITVDNRNLAYASIDGVLFDKNIRTLIQYPGGKNQRTYAIPPSVRSINNSAFEGCSTLTSVTIPSSVTSIAAFAICSSLTSITVDNRNLAYASIDGVLFDKNIRTLIKYPEGKNQRTYVIPSSVTSIREYAFASCDSLTSVNIPSSVTSVGRGAFAYCESLTNVTIPSSVTTIENQAFAYCESLTSVTLSRRTQVGEDVFPETARIIYRD